MKVSFNLSYSVMDTKPIWQIKPSSPFNPYEVNAVVYMNKG